MIDLHPEYPTVHGKPGFAVLPIEEFDCLEAYVEDLEDLLALRQAKDAEADAPALGIEELRHRLAADEPAGDRR